MSKTMNKRNTVIWIIIGIIIVAAIVYLGLGL